MKRSLSRRNSAALFGPGSIYKDDEVNLLAWIIAGVRPHVRSVFRLFFTKRLRGGVVLHACVCVCVSACAVFGFYSDREFWSGHQRSHGVCVQAAGGRDHQGQRREKYKNTTLGAYIYFLLLVFRRFGHVLELQ